MTIQKNINLADKTWFKTGGPARYYCEPKTGEEFIEAFKVAQNNKLTIFFLGEGANILISDTGFNGLVIKPDNTTITHIQCDKDYSYVTAGAGTSFSNLITYCLNNNLLGLEEFSGIPGTVGGSVYINIHYFEFLLSRFLLDAQIINTKTRTIHTVDNKWFNFRYNYSTLHNEQYYLINATFKLKNCSDIEAAYAKGRSLEIIRHRKNKYPNGGTCGSFFRNFSQNEITFATNGKKIIYVAYYLDKLGIKGELSYGNAIVSYKHANMLVNQGSATSNDFIKLARTMQELVMKQFNILPQPECQLIGFDKYPLIFPLPPQSNFVF